MRWRQLFLAAPLWFAVACGPTVYPVHGQFGHVPFEGELGVEQVTGRARRFTLAMRSVPEPWRRAPGTRAYIAWVVSATRGAFKIGRVEYDDLARKGTLDQRSEGIGTRFRVTAEAASWVREPSAHVLFEVPLGGDEAAHAAALRQRPGGRASAGTAAGAGEAEAEAEAEAAGRPDDGSPTERAPGDDGSE